MYNTNSGVFPSILVIVYLWLLAVLVWWVLGARPRRTVKKNILRASIPVLRALRFRVAQLRGKELKSGTAAGNGYKAHFSGHNWKRSKMTVADQLSSLNSKEGKL